jgi:hypothetical protein
MADNYLLKWDELGEHFYETGVDHAVLYPFDDDTKTYPNGVVWNGVSQITDNRSGADPNDVYADNIKYLSIRGAEDYGATVECYTTPPEFDECNGLAPLVSGIPGVSVAQQARKAFGLVWRTKIGSDTNADLGYKYHILYNGTASPSEVSHQTINDSPEPDTMSFEITTIPIDFPGLKPSANIEIDSTQFKTSEEIALLDSFLQILFGTPQSGATPAVAARLPLPEEVFSHFGGSATPEIEINKHNIALTVGDTFQLTPTKLIPADATVSWTSGNDSVATVEDNSDDHPGLVEAAGAGNTIITASIEVDDVTHTDTCTVVVTAASQG